MEYNVPWLVLVPTALEQRHLTLGNLAGVCVERCGFGATVSAARSAQLLAALKPKHVLLVGIAGSYENETEIGAAYYFRNVASHGIGVGTGEQFLSAQEMGWQQWPDDPTIEDCLALAEAHVPSAHVRELLVSTTAASSNRADALQKHKRFPNACAEDMEGFSVAAAARLSGHRLHLIRGISNVAGDRNFDHWQIETALQAVNKLAETLIKATA